MNGKKKRPHVEGASETLLGGVGVPEAKFTGVNANGQHRGARTTEAPRSWRPMFDSVACARDYSAVCRALADLVPCLLHRGQRPETVARDLTLLVRRANDRAHRHLAEVVLPVVHDCAVRGAA